MESSEIAQFYEGRSIFITGGSGFMGKVLIEKLLRSCNSLKKIYLLFREKKNKNVEERLDEMLQSKVFDRLKIEQPNYREKLQIIQGDLCKPLLGISKSDLELLASEVTIVYHAAATVRFDEKLRIAVEQNILGTKRLVEVCLELPKIEALVHVSTAYCNCDKHETEEVIYPSTVEPEQLIEAIKWMDDEMLDSITPKLLGNYPNTYSLTKNLGEKILLREREKLPIAIFRPSIVSPSWKEPVSGWIDSLNGPNGIIAGIMKGIIRTIRMFREKITDIIPVDLCINMMVAIPWYTIVHKPEDVKIYHCASSTLNPLSYDKMFSALYKPVFMYPSVELYRIPGGNSRNFTITHKLAILFDHYIPAAFTDALLFISGKKPRMISIYKKVDKALITFAQYSVDEWFFHCKNQFLIWDKMSDVDKKRFNFDIKSVDWDFYYENVILGIRKYLLNEDHSTLPKARENVQRMQLRSYAIKATLLAAGASYFLSNFFSTSVFEYLY